MHNVRSIIEALIFAAEEPIGLVTLSAAVEPDGIPRDQVKTALNELLQEYGGEGGHGLLLREVDGAYQFVTQPLAAPFLQRLQEEKPRSLSQAALETLAIIAYRQPIVRAEVEQIRGVDSGGVLKTLLEKGYLKIVGRKEEAGQPLIYGTAKSFLELFHLKNLEELPSMREIEQMVAEQIKQGEAAAEGTGDSAEEAATAFADDSSGEPVEDVADEAIITELESKMKNLHTLEKEIFPAPVAEEPPTEAPTPPEEKS